MISVSWAGLDFFLYCWCDCLHSIFVVHSKDFPSLWKQCCAAYPLSLSLPLKEEVHEGDNPKWKPRPNLPSNITPSFTNFMTKELLSDFAATVLQVCDEPFDLAWVSFFSLLLDVHFSLTKILVLAADKWRRSPMCATNSRLVIPKNLVPNVSDCRKLCSSRPSWR